MPSFVFAVAAAAVVAAVTVPHGVVAQTTGRIAAAPNPAAGVRSGQAATPGMPRPQGLRSAFPAGLTSGSGPAAAADVVAAPPGSDLATGAEVLIDPPTQGPAPSRASNGAGSDAPARPRSAPTGTGPFTPVEIAGSFIAADANRDGDLTRLEATRLSIMPLSFEAMDRNKDGVLTRGEYEDALR